MTPVKILSALLLVLAAAGCSVQLPALPTSSPTPSPTPVETVDEDAVEAAAIAQQVHDALLVGLAIDSLGAACDDPNLTWPCEVVEIRAGDKPGHVVAVISEEGVRADYAATMARGVLQLTCKEVPDLDLVSVETEAGRYMLGLHRSESRVPCE